MKYTLRILAVLSAALPVLAAPNLNLLLQVREKLNNTVWSKEVEAQEHERYFIHLWGQLACFGRCFLRGSQI
jgi:hypothetical protein